MDPVGRIVIPRRIRQQAGLQPGEPLEIRCHDGHIEIESAAREVRIEHRGGLPVAEPVGKYEPLREATLPANRDRNRGRRKVR